jgi:hypothetical protein
VVQVKWLKQKNKQASEKEYTNIQLYASVIVYQTLFAVIMLAVGMFVGFIIGYQATNASIVNMIDQNLTSSQIMGLIL